MSVDTIYDALREVKRDPTSFVALPEDLKGEYVVQKAAVQSDGMNLQFCSKALKDNVAFVEYAVANNPDAIIFASYNVQQALGYNPETLEHNPDLYGSKGSLIAKENEAGDRTLEIIWEDPYHTPIDIEINANDIKGFTDGVIADRLYATDIDDFINKISNLNSSANLQNNEMFENLAEYILDSKAENKLFDLYNAYKKAHNENSISNDTFQCVSQIYNTLQNVCDESEEKIPTLNNLFNSIKEYSDAFGLDAKAEIADFLEYTNNVEELGSGYSMLSIIPAKAVSENGKVNFGLGYDSGLVIDIDPYGYGVNTVGMFSINKDNWNDISGNAKVDLSEIKNSIEDYIKTHLEYDTDFISDKYYITIGGETRTVPFEDFKEMKWFDTSFSNYPKQAKFSDEFLNEVADTIRQQLPHYDKVYNIPALEIYDTAENLFIQARDYSDDFSVEQLNAIADILNKEATRTNDEAYSEKSILIKAISENKQVNVNELVSPNLNIAAMKIDLLEYNQIYDVDNVPFNEQDNLYLTITYQPKSVNNENEGDILIAFRGEIENKHSVTILENAVSVSRDEFLSFNQQDLDRITLELIQHSNEREEPKRNNKDRDREIER